MNKKSHTFLALAGICFSATTGVFLYTLHEINQQELRYSESKRLIGEYAAKEASFNTVQGLLNSTQADRDKIKLLFIQEKDTITFISQIESSAKSAGVTLTTNELSISPSVAGSNGVMVPASLLVGFDFAGSRDEVWKFMSLLENISYHKKITQVSFVKTDANLWKANVKMQLTLRYD